MKKILLLSTVTALAFYSCKPIYECGQPKLDKKYSARVQTVVDERDGLCSTVKTREAEISNLRTDVSELNNKISEVKKLNSDLNSDKLSQADQFNSAMKQKSDELIGKEKLLIEREKSLVELQRIIARQDSITKRLNDNLRNALLGFNSDELSIEIKNGNVYVSMSDKLLFKSGSAAVETKGKEALKVLADVLEKNSDIDILIEGHTDNVPIKTDVYRDNWDLSVARATTIVRILTDDYKIPPTRLTASGKGEFAPRTTNATIESRANNRRTEIILSPKLDEIMKLLNKG